jgi:hypothetical protein
MGTESAEEGVEVSRAREEDGAFFLNGGGNVVEEHRNSSGLKDNQRGKI